ncbi:MAG TPA: hypothetical protein VIH57_00045 [Bacteroidales bacterium]
MSFYLILVHLHSVLRWFILIFLIYSLIVSLIKWRTSTSLSKRDSLFAALTVYFSHLQLLVGIILYFISYKVMFNAEAMGSPVVRFFTVEHVSIMVIAIACLTIGNAKAKKATDPVLKARYIFLWFAIGFILIMAAIPWPFREMGSGWM